ncbi:MAG: 2-oxoglutarate ferredoxin oxidoreductase subunit alpha [Deltaproteobacteria bacterium]|nr:2-oxoglutarate ferredoxin oxidoreductase subunit alpha [Deltaproteobacteria bacterium]
MSTEPPSPTSAPIEQVSSVVIRFAGDSGDGVQLTGNQFTKTSALVGNDISTLPDFPAEIRAPAGTLFGVSGFQLQFGATEIRTPGDTPDVLVAFNPAALKVNIDRLRKGGLVIVNTAAFSTRNLQKAGYESNPLEDDTLSAWQLVKVDITKMTREALKDAPIKTKDKDRAKNLFALGMVYFLYDRPLDHTVNWLEGKFSKKPDIAAANVKALKTGYYYAETAEVFRSTYSVPEAPIKAGTYRNVTGNLATAMGLVAAAQVADINLFLGSYPITPASDLLHALANMRAHGVRTLQAEDEIAAVCSAIGASYAGNLGVCSTSGPGLALKGEAMGLALMVELPMVVVDVQRGGPSTGLPTKTEQSDLLIALYGRNGESPLPVIAARSPADCFDAAYEAVRITIKYRTPVLLLTDGYLANGSEPWRIPDPASLPGIDPNFLTEPEGFQPYARDPETLARPWVKPGTPHMEHRVGGLEKDDLTGNVSYDPVNHHKMCGLRRDKVLRIQNDMPPLEVVGEQSGDLLLIGWGGTHGAITTAVESARAAGKSVSSVHLRHLHPLHPDLGDLIRRFDKVLVPELNFGQLLKVLRAEYLVDAHGLHKMAGQPFTVTELEQAIEATLYGEA